ncbi:hypothetical protein BN1110_00137 [bacterium YEK0313]|nr:hypothetical protein BN1110_00137 [bacterium YEK0313]
MATQTETKIVESLFAELAALALTPPLPIALPNLDFTPPADEKWLRVSEAPSPILPAALAPAGPAYLAITPGARDYNGTIQVDVVWPQRTGITAPKEVAGAITAHFSPAKAIYGDGVKVKVIRSHVGAKVDEASRIYLPVTIQYRAFA